MNDWKKFTAEGKILHAIKAYRTEMVCGLNDARLAVQSYRDQLEAERLSRRFPWAIACDQGGISVIASDGTIWSIGHSTESQWVRRPDLPQPESLS